MTIGWGIIGIGDHADNIVVPSILASAGSKLVAVCSRDMGRAKDFAAKHKAERAYDSLDKMLADPALDALYIATPNILHAPQTIQAAQAGKHVICEKPMTLTLKDAENMIKASEKNKVKLTVSYQNRYNPAHEEARRLVRSGIVGDINVVKAQYCRYNYPWKGWRNDPAMAGAGALMGQGLHCVDLLRFLMDTEVLEVRSLLDDNPPKKPVDDMFYTVIKYANGANGLVMAGVLVPRSDNDAVLYGTKAKITCKGTVGKPVGGLGELMVDGDSVTTRIAYPAEKPLLYRKVRLIEDFNRWIEGGPEPYVTARDGMIMVAVADAIVTSSRQGKAVKVSKI